MARALTIAGMVVAGLIALIFIADLAVQIPFSRKSPIMDICFIAAAAMLFVMSFSTMREQ